MSVLAGVTTTESGEPSSEPISISRSAWPASSSDGGDVGRPDPYGGRMLSRDGFDALAGATEVVVPERTVRELRGVIEEVLPDAVKVEFDEGVSVEFPRQLFGDASFVRYGQSVVYSINERPSGLRYQRFAPIAAEAPNPFKAEVERLLSEIHPRRSSE